MKILDRYICREVLLSSMTVLFVLLLILTGNTLLRTIASVASGELPTDLIFPILGVNMLRQSVILVPLSFFLGVVLAMGRLYQDSEMAAITTGGVGILGLYKKLIWIIVPLSCLLFLLALFVNAWSLKQRGLLWKDAEKRVAITSISPGKFNANQAKDNVLFFERYAEDTPVAKQRLEKVFMQMNRNGDELVQIAQSANKHIDGSTGDMYMQYKDGQLHTENAEGFSVLEFEEHGVFFKEKVYPVYRNTRIESLPLAELIEMDDIKAIAELQMRIAVPLGSILFFLLAIPLSHTAPRKGRYSRLGYSILLYFLYFYILNLSRSWVEANQIPVFPGVFVVIFIILIALVICIVKDEGWLNRKMSRVNEQAAL